MDEINQCYKLGPQKCPLCGKQTTTSKKYNGIYKCSYQHGKFEWFDRTQLEGLDPSDIFNSLPYSIQIKNDYNVMRGKYLRGLKNRILQFYPKTSGISFLDVGCANGEYLSCAIELGMHPVMGVEIDQTAISNAVKVAPILSNISEVDASFDIILCKNVMGNVDAFQNLLKQLLSLLNPGGVLFLDVLNNYGLTALFKRWRGKPGMLNPPYIINGFSKEAIFWLVQKNNAEVVKMDTAYCGSDMVPYRWKLRLFLTGKVAVAAKAGVMILSDVKAKK